MAILEVQDLVKVYPGGVRAVDGVSFSVEEGEMFGFLGPNGAGKTTTIRICVTFLGATSGRVTVDGIDVAQQPEQASPHRLRGSKRGCGRRSHLAGTFSGGMHKRLDLAQALVHHPRLLFLDEPTTGLDPQNRRALWNYLRALNESGVTIFLTTLYLEEADVLCGRPAIIGRGRIKVEGPPSDLKAALGGDMVTVTIPADASPEALETTRAVLSAVPGCSSVSANGNSVSVVLKDGAARLAGLVRSLDNARVPVARLDLAEPTLDDVFLRHTGERLRVEEVKAPSHMTMGRGRRS